MKLNWKHIILWILIFALLTTIGAINAKLMWDWSVNEEPWIRILGSVTSILMGLLFGIWGANGIVQEEIKDENRKSSK